MVERNLLQIAIDGPVAAGKGTVALLLAKRLGIESIDSGAVLRAAALLCLQLGIEIDSKYQNQICEALRNATIEVLPSEDAALTNKVFLNGQEVTGKIRSPAVDLASSKISSLPKVYRLLTEKLKQLAGGKSLVMEGRNIATSVLPNAELKIYLTASVKERAHRRFLDYKKKGKKIDLETLLREIKQRDKRDAERPYDPLRIVEDSVVIDTTGMHVEGVVEKIISTLKKRGLLISRR